MSDVNGPAIWPIFNPPPIHPTRNIYVAAENPSDSKDIPWSHGGIVNPSADETGQPWPAPYDLTLDTLYLTIAAASNVNLIVHTYINGSDVDNRTLTIGSLILSFAVAIPMNAGDTLQPKLIAAATGTGVGLGIIYRYTHA